MVVLSCQIQQNMKALCQVAKQTKLIKENMGISYIILTVDMFVICLMKILFSYKILQ